MSLATLEPGRSEPAGGITRTELYDDPDAGHPEALILYMLASCAGFVSGIVLGVLYWL